MVKLLPGIKHNLEDGDLIALNGVEGMDLIEKNIANKEELISIN